MNFKKLERYLRVNLLGPGPRLIKKGFTGPRSHKGWETLVYTVKYYYFVMLLQHCWLLVNHCCLFCYAIIVMLKITMMNL